MNYIQFMGNFNAVNQRSLNLNLIEVTECRADTLRAERQCRDIHCIIQASKTHGECHEPAVPLQWRAPRNKWGLN